MTFERAVLQCLGTLPVGCWQRVDGLLTEPTIMRLPSPWFPKIRLWLLEKRGLIERQVHPHYWPSQRLPSYRLRADRGVAQRLEQAAYNRQVAGSNPAVPTTKMR